MGTSEKPLNYHICITGLADTFTPQLRHVSRLVDMLDHGSYLDKPDRDMAVFVRTPKHDIQQWLPYVRQQHDDPLETVRRRYVHLTYSPVAHEQPYQNYTELEELIEVNSPDVSFIASLGYCTRRLEELVYFPVLGEKRRWIESLSAYIMRGYHPLWRRVYNEERRSPEWELIAVKGFNFMLVCKLAPGATIYSLEEYIEILRLKDDFTQFLGQVGKIIGTMDFEIFGEVSF